MSENNLDSLADFVRHSVSNTGKPIAIPVDDEWYRKVHSDTTGTLSCLTEQLLRVPQLVSLAMSGSGVPREKRCNSVIQYVSNVVLGSSPDTFMGPLCSPLRRQHSSLLCSNKYFITEKSDGSRVILVSLRIPHFPEWVVVAVEGTACHSVNLVDTALLECAAQTLRESPTPVPISLSMGNYIMHVDAKEGAGEGEGEGEDNGHSLYSLDLQDKAQHSDSTTNDAPCERLVAKRSIAPRHLTYCFDRSMESVYLLLDKYTFDDLDAVVLDGELLCVGDHLSSFNAKNTSLRYVLGCFDVFSFSSTQDSWLRSGEVCDTNDEASPLEPAENSVRTPSPVSLHSHTMSQRYAIMQRIFKPKKPEAENDGRVATMQKVTLYCKDMWPVSDISQCLSRLSCVPHTPCEQQDGQPAPSEAAGYEYYFDGRFGKSKNDGLIFTPDDFVVKSGASATQLKWKWPSCLSVDWRVRADAKLPGQYRVENFFRKKRFAHDKDSVGHAVVQHDMSLLNPKNIPIPSTGDGVVAECVFDYTQGLWSIQKVRSDKNTANSAITVVSVMESVVEHITLRALLGLLSPDRTADKFVTCDDIKELLQIDDSCGRVSDTPHRQGSAPVAFGKQGGRRGHACQFTMRASQQVHSTDQSLKLLWSVQLPSEKNLIPVPYVDVRDCFGLGCTCPAEDPQSRLTEHLYIALANAGGSCAWSDFTVNAVFDGESGRWCIVYVCPQGKNRFSTCAGVMLHLNTQLAALGSTDAATGVEVFRNQIASSMARKYFPQYPRSLTDEHYSERTRELSSSKNQRSNLRRFNNWVKSVLIGRSCIDVGIPHPIVCDLCCGRGGDLHKWRSTKPSYLFMVDSCFEAVAEAAARYCVASGLSTKVVSSNRDGPGVPARFGVADCFDDQASASGPPSVLGMLNDLQSREVLIDQSDKSPVNGFHIVSCQFSMHYAFKDIETAEGLLSVVSQLLVIGGVYVGTTVNDAVLESRHNTRGSVFGNSVYNISFAGTEGGFRTGEFGVAYEASVEKSVEVMTEYVVPWNAFVELASGAPYHLELVQEESLGFEEAATRYTTSKDGQELWSAIFPDGKRKRSEGDEPQPIQSNSMESVLNAEEIEAAGLFRTFIFRKMRPV